VRLDAIEAKVTKLMGNKFAETDPVTRPGRGTGKKRHKCKIGWTRLMFYVISLVSGEPTVPQGLYPLQNPTPKKMPKTTDMIHTSTRRSRTLNLLSNLGQAKPS
jgi:hypothetical protein